jgi:hypothetical protein
MGRSGDDAAHTALSQGLIAKAKQRAKLRGVETADAEGHWPIPLWFSVNLGR